MTADTGSWATGISAITLLVEDLATTKRFYQDIFGLPIHYEDADLAVFAFGPTLINLLSVARVPNSSSRPSSRHRTRARGWSSRSRVDDVDAKCAELAARGVQLLNGPMDRPWGIRTASFRDPAGTSGRSRSSFVFHGEAETGLSRTGAARHVARDANT